MPPRSGGRLDGRWRFTPPAALGDGDHPSDRSPTIEGERSRIPSALPTHRYPGAGCAADRVSRHRTGGEGVLLANGSITNQRINLSGTGEPGTIITLYNNGVEAALPSRSIHRVAGPIR